MRNSYYPKDEAKNEFMQNDGNNPSRFDNERQKVDEYQKMFMMFQKMATDPSLFMKMMSSVASPESEQDQRKRQFQVEQHKYRNHQVSPKRRDADSPIAAKQSRKRGTDVLGRSNPDDADNVLQKYYQVPNEKLNNLTQSNITISTKQQHIAQIEDRPIQSAYALNKKPSPTPRIIPPPQQQPINRYTADEDRPIKPAKGYNYEMEANQSGIMNNNSSVVNPSKYYEAEERPIKGIQGDFKAYIMKEQGFPMTENAEEHQEHQEEHENAQVPKARTFLKRGSRQYLSSAKDKSVGKPKGNTKGDPKQELDFSKAIMKDEEDKPQRSISQNRVLGRKSISSKSITKKPVVKPKQNQQKKTLQYSNTTSNYNTISNQGNRTPRINQNNELRNRENSSSPTFQTESEVKVVTKPPAAKKNIFQGSSSDEDDQKTQSVATKKNEVIPGVFLNKRELHQILTKYGKSAPAPSPDLSDLQELKSKYIELSNIQIAQKQKFQTQMMKQREEFEQYKLAEIAKIKNQRKVQERNMMNLQKTKEKEKQKEQFENLKKTLEKEREQFRHKEKNYKLMIEKYKKAAEQRQKSASIQQQKTQNFQSVKNQELPSKKKTKNTVEQVYTETDEGVTVSNSYKGVEENNGYNINKRTNEVKESSLIKDNNKLPNYQDLKKSSGPTNSTQNASKLAGSVVQQNSDKNKKYEYYEELENKETVKNKNNKLNNFYQPDEEEDDNRSEEEDRQQIVEYNPSMKLSDLTKIPLNIKMVTDKMIDNLFRSENNPEYRKYLELTRKPRNKIHTSRSAAEKKTTNVYADGGKQIVFDTGVRKQYFNNGYVIIFFSNGDIKQKLPDQTVLYFYKEKQVDQITLPNKTNIYRFDNNQIEFHYEDGTVQVRHPDGTFKIV